MQKIIIRNDKSSIKIGSARQTISIDADTKKFSVKNTKKAIRIRQVGLRGLPGEPGKDGAGVPPGGLPGQLLVKIGFDDYDSGWATSEGSDKYYIQNFLTSSSVIVDHNLAKYPAVSIHDSASDEVVGEIEHLSINSLQINFSAPFSGTVTCN